MSWIPSHKYIQSWRNASLVNVTVTKIAEIDGVRFAVACGSGNLRGAAVWESNGRFNALILGKFGQDLYQQTFESYCLDHVVGWAIVHMRITYERV